MTDSVEARAAAMTQMKSLIAGVTGIKEVVGHDPLGAMSSRTAAVVYMGESRKEATFGNVMVRTRFEIRVFWPVSNANRAALDDYQQESWDFTRAIQAALSGDRELGGNVTALYMDEPAEAAMRERNEGEIYWVLTIPVELEEMEAEAIAL